MKDTKVISKKEYDKDTLINLLIKERSFLIETITLASRLVQNAYQNSTIHWNSEFHKLQTDILNDQIEATVRESHVVTEQITKFITKNILT